MVMEIEPAGIGWRLLSREIPAPNGRSRADAG